MEGVKQQLSREKRPFLDDLESSIKKYIESQGKNCIGINQMKNDSTIHMTWDLRDDIDDFAKVLYHFLRKNPPQYHGYALDSVLSQPITKIVIESWTKLFNKHNGAISNDIITSLVNDRIKLKSFLSRVSDIVLDSCTDAVRKRIADKIADQIADSVQHGTLNAVGQHISHVAATTAGSTVLTTVTHILIKLIAMHATQIVAKILASSFLTHLITAVAKKVVFAAVLSFLSIHFGIVISSSAFMWIALPAIAGYIVYSIATFPEKLGTKVSQNVRQELAEKYENINNTILQKIWSTVVEGDEIVGAIAKDRAFVKAMEDMARQEKRT